MAISTVQDDFLQRASHKNVDQISGIWDSLNARFETDALKYIAAVPAVVAATIFLSLVCQILTCQWHSPKWSRPFVGEPKESLEDVRPQAEQPFTQLAKMLLAVSFTGFVLQLLTLFYPYTSKIIVYPTVAWAVVCVLIASRRPATAPKSLLAFYLSILFSQSVVLLQNISGNGQHDIPAILVLLTIIGAIIICLQMPMRHPSLSNKGISPAFGPPTHDLRSPEDNLTLWQWMTVSWVSPLIAVGYERQLNKEDVWLLAYEFQHRPLHNAFRACKGSLIWRIIEATRLDCFLISIFAIVEVAANFSAPVLLQKILQTMEYSGAPGRAALTYAAMSLIVRLIAAQSAVLGLWFSRRAFERCRGALITMLHEKSLSRKFVSIDSTVDTEEEDGETMDVAVNGPSSQKHDRQSWLFQVLNYIPRMFRSTSKSKTEDEKEKPKASMGKIYNLVRFDCWEVANRLSEFNAVVTMPLTLVFSVVLIYQLIGWPCLIGVLTIFVAQGINALIARALLRWETIRREATDTKLHKMSQFVESLRHLRLYGWQDAWLSGIMEARQHELNIRIVTSILNIMISFTNTFASGMFPVVAFYAYTALAGMPLRIDVAFPALQLFSMLESSLRALPNLVTLFINARVALGRIEDFMHEPDKEDAEDLMAGTQHLEMKGASFAWPGARKPVLSDITLSFSPGLTIVFGEVGSGKTALLQALLGELDQLGGEYVRSSAMIGYCGQTPWLQSMSIRENILFGAPYEHTLYNQVLEASALIPDMANLQHGDLSMIGENGVGLSGGQRARVSLARAIYSRSNILLLDDPLSALDYQTAETIMARCFMGPLMTERTTILVTHRTELCMSIANQAVQLIDGRAHVHEPDSLASETLSKVTSQDSAIDKNKEVGEDQRRAAIPEKFVAEEHRAHGGIKAHIYWEYIKAGKPVWWGILICALLLYRFINVGETWFLKQWGEAYDQHAEISTSKPLLDIDFPSPESNIRPWLIGFFVLAVAKSLAYLLSQGVMLVIVYNAGKSLFAKVLTSVANATFRFYDITPVGRLTNRLTSDLNTIDGNITNYFQTLAFQGITWLSSMFVIGSVTPIFLIFALTITLFFILIFRQFLPTSQSLRRLEYTFLSPLFSNFGALSEGLTTIRAYGVQSRFQDMVMEATDSFQKCDHYYWALQAWLMLRFDVLSSTSTFLLTTLALYTGVSPGLTAFVLTAASRFVTSTHALCKQYGKLQMEFVSVERVIELLYLDLEPRPSLQPPPNWPSPSPSIVFEDITIRYAPQFPPALQNVSLTLPGGQTTALVGRTGSGKSTLALSLLHTTPPISGRVFIDKLDISTIDPLILRQRLTFLSQDPVLFPGSMRSNLDPLCEYSDSACSTVLHKIAERHGWTLDTIIDTGGRNLSQGQRQLVGLARALLRGSRVIIMDEATASVDVETAGRVLDVLRRVLKDCTVVVVAHRREAVKGAAGVVVLAKGRVVESGEEGRLVEVE